MIWHTYSIYVIQEGGFYSAEDADSLPETQASAKREGAFYVWTYDEVKNLLDKKIPGNNIRFFDLICYHFNVKKEGNVRKTQVCIVVVENGKYDETKFPNGIL